MKCSLFSVMVHTIYLVLLFSKHSCRYCIDTNATRSPHIKMQMSTSKDQGENLNNRIPKLIILMSNQEFTKCTLCLK